MSLRFLSLAAAMVVAAVVTPAARADDRPTDATTVDPATLPAPTPPGTPGTTTVVAPPGSGGVTVVVPTPGGGSVTASGCSTVVVNGSPTLIGPGGAPCPTMAPYQPYAPPPPFYDIRPKYAPDPDRKAAVIASSIGFGVGGGVSGIMYLVQWGQDRDDCRGEYVRRTDGTYGYEPDPSACRGGGSRTSLITYGAIMTFVPSLPRFVVGDTTKGLVYTALRGVSFATAALVDWGRDGDTEWQGPFLLGFAVPVTLGIIDLATTPHREDVIEKEKVATTGIKGVSPIAITDRSGKTHGAVFSIQGLF